MLRYVTHALRIDAEASYSQLLDQWQAGQRAAVADALAADHSGLAALVIVQGAQDGRLKLDDCNVLANMLIARRAVACGNPLAASLL